MNLPRLALLAALPLASFVALTGCGPVQPTHTPTSAALTPPTHTDPMPPKATTGGTGAKPTEKVAEPVKVSDPWEEARAYFKKVKETEKEKTESKLKKLDIPTERSVRYHLDLFERGASLDSPGPTRGLTLGEHFLQLGFTEFVTAKADWSIADDDFKKVFAKLNSTPTTGEIVAGCVAFATTEPSLRRMTIEIIKKGNETRALPDTHKAATAWSGK